MGLGDRMFTKPEFTIQQGNGVRVEIAHRIEAMDGIKRYKGASVYVQWNEFWNGAAIGLTAGEKTALASVKQKLVDYLKSTYTEPDDNGDQQAFLSGAQEE